MTRLLRAGSLLILAVWLLSAVACATTPSSNSASNSVLAPWPADPPARAIWPGKPPGVQHPVTTTAVTERSEPPALRDRYMLGITSPQLYVFPANQPNGSAMLVIPGGGYKWVVMDKEGFELGQWLAGRGITAFVLMYRLPGEHWSAGPDTPLQDTQRAVRWIRFHAEEFALHPQKLGVIGFSAGGHAAASLITRFEDVVYAPVDAVDELSARPDFAALMYPVISMRDGLAHAASREHLLGPDYSAADIAAHSPEQNVRPDTPPVFLLHAEDDAAVPVGNSLVMYESLRAAGVAAELHIYPDGGHGFGLRYIEGTSVAEWPQLLESWIRLQTLGD